jgi:class 3 adenylate cyclase
VLGVVTCPSCGGPNTGSQRFCGSCGASLLRLCSVCGEHNNAGSRFCGSCGVEIGPSGTTTNSPELDVEERRWMTIVFADLSGYTSLAERSDPEDVRSLVDRCMCLLGDVVHQFGGTLHQIAGDGLLAVFGAPVAHEDDAERAVRAALEMQNCAQHNASDFGGLPLRIGVNTGEVMFAPVGPTGRREQAVVGDIVNTAARLQTAAPTNAILVGEETWRATNRSITYEPVKPFRVKNKAQPVSAWLATGCNLTPAERPVSSVPMVGRDTELQLLTSLWQQVGSDVRASLVTVCGPAGIGKSRLCREFATVAQRSGSRFLQGRSLPYGESTAYGAFAQIIKKAAGIFDSDSIECSRAKLACRVAELLPEYGAAGMASHLEAIVGLGTRDVATDRQVLFVSAARFIEALCVEQPTIFYFEDAHWAESSLLDLLEFLAKEVEQSHGLFLVSARPELLDARERWADDERHRRTVILEALPESAADELSIRLLGSSPGLSPTVVERLRIAAGGNPLFIEELAASLTQRTIDSAQALPTNLTALITARLDSLPPEQRRVILDASVVGGTFWRGAVAALRSHRMLDDALESLEAQDLIRRQDDSRIEGDIEFSFKHAIIREVAYRILSKASRRKHHAAVARFIQGAPGASTAETTLVLAHHWRHSTDPWRAVDYLIAAAEQAGRGWAKQEAVSLYNQALELMPEGDSRRPRVALKRAVAFQAWLHMSLDVDSGVRGLADR